MTRSVLALVLALLLAAAPSAMAQTPPPPPPPGPSADDLDGDGIPNHLDGCPNESGAAGNGGCPPDTDGDGVNDALDACPTVAGGSASGCPITLDPGPPPPTDTGRKEIVLPTATSVSASSASIRTSGGALMLSGSPFFGGPTEMSVMTPKRLTIWLPKSIKVSSAPAKPCTQAFARTMDITTSKRCAKILAGRLGGNGDIHAWFAWAGPKQGAKQRLWLRGRGTGDDDGALVGLGTGWIEPVKGGTKLTLELGQLGIDTRGLEVYSGAERTTAGRVRPLTGKCTGTFRMRLDTAQGSATKSFRC